MPDGGSQCKGLHPQVLVLMPAQLNSTGPTSTAKNESDHRPDYIPGAQVFSSAVDQAVNAFPKQGKILMPAQARNKRIPMLHLGQGRGGRNSKN